MRDAVGGAEPVFGERQGHHQPALADKTAGKPLRQRRTMRRQRLHEARVESAVGAGEQHRGLRQPREHAARRHARLPGGGLARAGVHVEEAGDEGAPARAGGRLVGGTQVAQPAEAAEAALPVVGGDGAEPLRLARLEREGRAAAGVHDAAAEGEIAGRDVGGDRRVGGADVLRRDQQALWRPRAQPRRCPARQRRRAPRPAPCPAGKDREKAQTICERWPGQNATPGRNLRRRRSDGAWPARTGRWLKLSQSSCRLR